MSLLKHRHAPVPATIYQETGADMEQARLVRSIIKELTREELTNPEKFPKTSSLPENSSDQDVVLSAIAETLNGEVKEIDLKIKSEKVTLLHVTAKDKDTRSIGFNTNYTHFYLRSENEINESQLERDSYPSI